MDDFLYLLLIVAWLVFTFYSRSQKKKAGKTGGAPVKKSEKKEVSILETLLGESLGIDLEESETKEVEVFEKEEPVPASTPFRTAYTNAFMDRYGKRSSGSPFLRHELASFRGEGEGSIFDSEIGDAEKGGERPSPPIDLREAVIYSAILNPPYI